LMPLCRSSIAANMPSMSGRSYVIAASVTSSCEISGNAGSSYVAGATVPPAEDVIAPSPAAQAERKNTAASAAESNICFVTRTLISLL